MINKFILKTKLLNYSINIILSNIKYSNLGLEKD